ncbi:MULTISPECIES: YcaO-like family protein [unclassified Rhizobium]|uniref:YcaO-like family protein n=1 Tax=unclassified Rhizobium TaxID=2613769 RepID=UPI00161CF503|nr:MULTISPECIES: YcaO-like family protein [unclassified Rhizobium]
MSDRARYTDRTVAASETLLRTVPLLAGFGITRVARHTGLDFIGLPVWCAYIPNGRSIAISQGKGLTDEDARVSAIMEALERVVANAPSVSVRRASARKLKAEGLAFDSLPSLIGRHQQEIQPDEEVDWGLGADLLADRGVYVPVDAAVLDRTRHNRFWMSSDGLASGNTPEEAILHGLLERIERDAYCLWQVGSEEDRLASCLDAACIGDPVLDGLLATIETAGLDIRLFDMTTDIGVPCVTAVMGAREPHRQGARFVEVTGGSGAHLFMARAAIRAVTEAVQSRMTYISGARDDIPAELFRTPAPAETLRLLDAVPLGRDSLAPFCPGNVTDHLRVVLDILRSHDVGPAIALSLAPPSLPFHVVKVFMPALENPEGARAHLYGPRALAKAICS